MKILYVLKLCSRSKLDELFVSSQTKPQQHRSSKIKHS